LARGCKPVPPILTPVHRSGGDAGPDPSDIRRNPSMSRFEHTSSVDVPVREAYDQWTQFEQFPQFMDHVESVVQTSDKTLDWTVDIGGQRRTFSTEITDQTPDTRIAWRSTSGTKHAGAVLFRPLGSGSTEITLRIDTDPEGVVENVGDALGFTDRSVKGDLERFSTFIEDRRVATGAWRGEVHGAEVTRDA
jgi:uncharacterized membrane protein